MDYPWYETVDGEVIEQGDLLFDFDIFVPLRTATGGAQIQGELKTFDLVVSHILRIFCRWLMVRTRCSKMRLIV